jgi:hypothetical protein
MAAVSDQLKNKLGAPQQLSPSGQIGIAVPTYSPSSGRWIVAWASRPQYQSTFAPGPMIVRESFCQGLCQ